MSRPRHAERRRVVSADLLDAFEYCEFRSILGIAPPSPDDPLESLLPRISHALAVLGDQPDPISPETMAELVASIRAGGSVLLMSNRAELRDHARREILAMVDLVIDGAHPATARRGAVH